MSLTNLAPWRRPGLLRRSEVDPFTSLRDEMNRVFEGFFNGDDGVAPPAWAEPLVPRLDLSETPTEVQLTMELPGMSEQDIDVELLENAVKIHGEKKDERETKEHNFHRMERTFGSFERVVPLPVKINREEVKAQVRNGVLTVVLPKAEPAMGQQKIPVMGA
jgi:HSP20 family protein